MAESLFVLPSGAFRFELGVRRGDEAFFRHTPADASLLAERERWLVADPHLYARALPGSEPMLAEAVAFARGQSVEIPAITAEPVALGKVWAPDFLLLSPREDGVFILRAGCVCFPTYWDLGEKLGQPMAAIHSPVPTLNAALGRQVDGFLAALRPGVVWERWNWGLAASPELNNHPARELPRLTAVTPLNEIWLRVEHQAFVRLPGGVLFGIRVLIEPLREVARESAAAERLAQLLETMPAAVAEYKGLAAVRPNLLDALRRVRG